MLMGFKYQYALTSVQFDSSYENAIRFDTRAQQEEYFKVSTLFANAKSVNFDFGNLINTTLVIKVKKAPMELMGYNYLILKDLNQNPTHKYIYFFIDKVEYISGGDNDSDTTIRLDLTIDVLNTYMLDIAWDDGALIERASLDRWDNINGYLYYNLKPDSPFRLDDEGEAKCSKVLINRENLQVLSSDYDISSVTSLFYDWINQYVQCWEYVFWIRIILIYIDLILRQDSMLLWLNNGYLITICFPRKEASLYLIMDYWQFLSTKTKTIKSVVILKLE